MNKQELLHHCKVFEQGYVDVGQLIYDKGLDVKTLRKTHAAILALEEGGNQPAQYYESSALTYLLSHSLTDSKALKRLLKQYEAIMQPRSKQVLSSMIDHSAFWSFFSVVEIHEDDFFTIVDLLSGETHQLYSARLSNLVSDPQIRDKHFLTLVYSNGECLHTAGVLRFNSLSVSDLRFYCSLFHHKTDTDLDTLTLKDVINNHYLEFFELDAISLFEKQYDGSQELQRIWQPFTLEEFDITKLGGTWETVEIEDQIKFNLLEPDEGMRSLPNGKLLFSEYNVMEGQLVRDVGTGEMWLSTWTDKAYLFFSRLLSRSYPNLKLPKKPSFAISLPLSVLLSTMEIGLPWSHFKEIILALTDTMIEDLYGDEDEDEDVLWQLEEEEAYQILPDTRTEQHINDGSVVASWLAEFAKEDEIQNKLQAEYIQSKQKGIPFDKEEFCLRTGALSEDVARFVLERDYYTVPSVDKEFELEGLPLSHRKSLWAFSQRLEESGLFRLDEGPNTLDAFNALIGGQYKDNYFSVGLLGFIEGTFFEFFPGETFAYYIVNHFFWILFHKGKDWLPVRSYAIEMLKRMPGIILQKYDEPEAFIADFSLFAKKFLSSRGICSLKASAEDQEVALIKGSDAFYSLVEGVNAW